MRSLRQAVWRQRPAAMVAIVARDTRLMVLLAAALIWALLGVVRPAIHADAGLVGDYFDNVNWNGQPAFSVVDAEPSTATMRDRWNNALPEQFSVRWTGFLTVGRSGLYSFSTASDDGSQLFIDNRVVVDNGGPHGLTTRTGSIRLDGGSHPWSCDTCSLPPLRLWTGRGRVTARTIGQFPPQS